MKRRFAALLVPPLLVLAGCTAAAEPTGSATSPDRAPRPSPFADCATLTAPPAPATATPTGSAGAAAPTGSAGAAAPTGSAGAGDGSGTAGSPAPADGGGSLLPELTLSCFTGGSPVALRDIHGPAVINVWASWCPPCRQELPAFQRLSVRAAGQLQVIGVNSRDSRDGAQAIGEDFGIRFPVLFDQGEALQRELRRTAVPLTLLVDAQGRIRHTDNSGALDDARLADLVRRHLGLAVPA
ncbi:TlpA disulfide reductase family protein [Micromonospora sp. RL09-050-HVF-A]|uniref:TlpA family protein disulfide reductase n=1 Tax=Micromonospora sp. RL09-050-HVF-A TaxID=1703433 RepID=UPI001C5D1941|nr:TlpA disulfide reductase family protein [Micromonospora sp. RL09-050-HVF-A]MBW4703649.1 TlpA family protein disulfide reductase [Micromonospora sp. RL09-050-HVF-A]